MGTLHRQNNDTKQKACAFRTFCVIYYLNRTFDTSVVIHVSIGRYQQVTFEWHIKQCFILTIVYVCIAVYGGVYTSLLKSFIYSKTETDHTFFIVCCYECNPKQWVVSFTLCCCLNYVVQLKRVPGFAPIFNRVVKNAELPIHLYMCDEQWTGFRAGRLHMHIAYTVYFICVTFKLLLWKYATQYVY